MRRLRRPTIVTLAKGNKTLFNDEPVTEAQLRDKLAVVGRAADASIVISADREVQHGVVMHVIDLAKLGGITKFALNVEQVR